jgi:hypothetical protein
MLNLRPDYCFGERSGSEFRRAVFKEDTEIATNSPASRWSGADEPEVTFPASDNSSIQYADSPASSNTVPILEMNSASTFPYVPPGNLLPQKFRRAGVGGRALYLFRLSEGVHRI